MKFELDEEQKTIKEAVREFAEKEIKPRGRSSTSLASSRSRF
ncbi:MAG: hypothetical protein OD814_000409 [Candidatus Alkanophagales archaeon MCA70_species_1]|nr:hypothetical protein [Candidatus Alkanophaga volatiphilum]